MLDSGMVSRLKEINEMRCEPTQTLVLQVETIVDRFERDVLARHRSRLLMRIPITERRRYELN